MINLAGSIGTSTDSCFPLTIIYVCYR
jgi:hypothetical protein